MGATLHNLEAEARLLSIIAEEGRIFGAARARALLESCGVQPGDLVDRHARATLEVLREVLARGLAPIRAVVEPELVRRGGDGATWAQFSQFFMQHVATAQEVQGLAVALKNLASRRRAYDAARRIIALAETGEAVGVELASEMYEAAKSVPGYSGSWRTARGAAEAAGRRIRAVQDGRMSPNVPTGFAQLDRVIGGLPPTLCVLCGRAGVVKSGIAASILRNVARRGAVGALFSLEDRLEWLGFRYLAHHSGVAQFILRNRALSEGQWGAVAQADTEVGEWDSRILVDDRPGLKPGEILVGAREAFAERGAALIVVDNMTAVRFGRGERRDLDVQDFLAAGRELADEFKAPFLVIAHSHNREGTKPGDIPRLADCREAPGAFENLARLALGVAYDPPPLPKPGEAQTPASDFFVKVGVLKTQNGRPTGGAHIELAFRPSSGLLEDVERERASQEPLL